MAADAAAVEAMRATFDNVPFDGRVAIGEGERDEAPMLYIGEQLGCDIGNPNVAVVDIAVDPLECTNNCADNLPNSIAVLGATGTRENCFMHLTATWIRLPLDPKWKVILRLMLEFPTTSSRSQR